MSVIIMEKLIVTVVFLLIVTVVLVTSWYMIDVPVPYDSHYVSKRNTSTEESFNPLKDVSRSLAEDYET